MLVAHYPMFGSATVDAHIIKCPTCPETSLGVSDWQDRDISQCNPGDEYVCNVCKTKVIINWGMVEPDHLSTWISSEHCQHRLCKIKYKEMKDKLGWNNNED